MMKKIIGALFIVHLIDVAIVIAKGIEPFDYLFMAFITTVLLIIMFLVIEDD